MKTIDLKLTEIKPYDKNPRDNDGAVDAVAASIKEFGFRQPIVVDKNGVIIVGHTRYKAAQKLGLDTVPVLVAKDLTDEQVKAYRLADNKTAELAGWDFGLLNEELFSIDGIDMEQFGFDVSTFEEEKEVEEDEYEEPDDIPHRVKLGDVWQLGEHRLICGDSTDEGVIEKLMDGERAVISFTSPPYNMGGSSSATSHVKGKLCKYLEGDDNLKNYEELLMNSTNNMLKYSRWAFINLQLLSNNKLKICSWLNSFRESLCDVCIWYKTNFTPAGYTERVMNSQFEFIFIFNKDTNKKAIGTNPFRGNVSNVYCGNPQNKNEYSSIHAATFPIDFVAHFLKTFINEGESCLDIFGGTGTTLIACEQLNRKCYMSELYPHYCDVIIDRWEKLTGKKAEKIDV